jgi:succinylglutamate desuccinylase
MGVNATATIETNLEVDHMIGSFCGNDRGPSLIAVGSIHGNEPSGARALRNIAPRLRAMAGKLRGRVFFIEGNVRAGTCRARFLDSDLNRHWTNANLGRAGQRIGLVNAEDLELSELVSIFREIVKSARDEVFVLDLHSTSAGGRPFATVGDTLRNRHFAQKFPVTILLGIEEQLEGTMLEYLNNKGAVTLGFEGGQHDAAETTARHEALVWLALVNSGIAGAGDIPDLETHRRKLRMAVGRERVIEVRHREAISQADDFAMNPGFRNFDPIKKGQVLAHNRHGPIKAVEDGLIVMPLYQKKGEDGFFIGREVAPFWIRLSEIVRRRKLAQWMFILPGVKRHPTDPESLIVNTAVARFFPLQIFHLLGFRRRVWEKNHLVVSRRKYDTQSPFVRDKTN